MYNNHVIHIIQFSHIIKKNKIGVTKVYMYIHYYDIFMIFHSACVRIRWKIFYTYKIRILGYMFIPFVMLLLCSQKTIHINSHHSENENATYFIYCFKLFCGMSKYFHNFNNETCVWYRNLMRLEFNLRPLLKLIFL